MIIIIPITGNIYCKLSFPSANDRVKGLQRLNHLILITIPLTIVRQLLQLLTPVNTNLGSTTKLTLLRSYIPNNEANKLKSNPSVILFHNTTKKAAQYSSQ